MIGLRQMTFWKMFLTVSHNISHFVTHVDLLNCRSATIYGPVAGERCDAVARAAPHECVYGVSIRCGGAQWRSGGDPVEIFRGGAPSYRTVITKVVAERVLPEGTRPHAPVLYLCASARVCVCACAPVTCQ